MPFCHVLLVLLEEERGCRYRCGVFHGRRSYLSWRVGKFVPVRPTIASMLVSVFRRRKERDKEL